MKRVAVFFGGVSNEHDISVLTGMMAVNLLKSAGYEVLPVYLPLSGGMTLAKNASRAEDFAGGRRYALRCCPQLLPRRHGGGRHALGAPLVARGAVRFPFDGAFGGVHG